VARRYGPAQRRPNLRGESLVRRRLSTSPYCHFCGRRVFNPRNRAEAPSGRVAALDFAKESRAGADYDEHNSVLVCEECHAARRSMSAEAFLSRAQQLRALPDE